jgi:hypothetical protein
MDVQTARENIALAYVTLRISHSTDPLKDSEFRKLEGQMMDIKEKFDELVE